MVALLPSYKCCPLKGDRLLVTTWAIVPLVKHPSVTLVPLSNPRSLQVIDGRPISSGNITHTTTVNLLINQHQEKLPMFVTQLGHYPIVLGIPWIDLHDINIRFHSRTVTFGSQYCSTHCLPQKSDSCSSSQALKLAPKVAHRYEPAVSAGAGEIEARLSISHRNPDKINVDNVQKSSSSKPIQIAALGGCSFRRVAHKQKLTVFSISLYEINLALHCWRRIPAAAGTADAMPSGVSRVRVTRTVLRGCDIGLHRTVT